MHVTRVAKETRGLLTVSINFKLFIIHSMMGWHQRAVN